jgi:hypothetical protein
MKLRLMPREKRPNSGNDQLSEKLISPGTGVVCERYRYHVSCQLYIRSEDCNPQQHFMNRKTE